MKICNSVSPECSGCQHAVPHNGMHDTSICGGKCLRDQLAFISKNIDCLHCEHNSDCYQWDIRKNPTPPTFCGCKQGGELKPIGNYEYQCNKCKKIISKSPEAPLVLSKMGDDCRQCVSKVFYVKCVSTGYGEETVG